MEPLPTLRVHGFTAPRRCRTRPATPATDGRRKKASAASRFAIPVLLVTAYCSLFTTSCASLDRRSSDVEGAGSRWASPKYNRFDFLVSDRWYSAWLAEDGVNLNGDGTSWEVTKSPSVGDPALDLLRAMASDAPLEGYSVKPVDDRLVYEEPGQFRQFLVKTYEGGRFTGFVYRIEPLGEGVYRVGPRFWPDDLVLGIALKDERMERAGQPAGDVHPDVPSTTEMYVVEWRGDADGR